MGLRLQKCQLNYCKGLSVYSPFFYLTFVWTNNKQFMDYHWNKCFQSCFLLWHFINADVGGEWVFQIWQCFLYGSLLGNEIWKLHIVSEQKLKILVKKLLVITKIAGYTATFISSFFSVLESTIFSQTHDA